MINEIVQFTGALSSEFKQLGLKPKEGLHLLLTIKKQDQQVMIEEAPAQVAFTRSKDPSTEDSAFLARAAMLAQKSWCVNTNKCFDLPVKAIHSCSPYCLAVKRENLTGGEKFKKLASEGKKQVYDRIQAYFSKAADLLKSEEDRQVAKMFEYALNTQEKLDSWLSESGYFDELKDSDYVIFYLDVPLEKYQATNSRYLADKLFNTNDFNKQVGDSVYGTSDFFNGFPTKKPFLSHQSASFDIAGRISQQQAVSLYEFQEILSRGILPKPLPIFIHLDEIKEKRGQSLLDSSITIFKREAENGNRIGYQEIMREMYEKHGEDLGNYYLLFIDRTKDGDIIRDFDFVPKFDYELKTQDGKPWTVFDLFGIGKVEQVHNIFDFQYNILHAIFDNGLIVRSKTRTVQTKYFDEIDSKYTRSSVYYLAILRYRKAIYDFVYKSQRQAVSETMFNTIMQTLTLEDIRLDEIANGYHTRDRNIRQKLNIWFSLKELFNQSNHKNVETMANKLKEHREFIKKLAKGEVDIENDEQYAFAAGQVIYYLMTKSKTADRSYKRLEPFLQQVKSRQLNVAISRMFDQYKHENFSANFRNPFAQVVDYDTERNLRDFTPTLIAGIFSSNALFTDKEYEEVTTALNESENND